MYEKLPVERGCFNMNVLKELIALELEAKHFGFVWPNQYMILDQIIDECREIREEIDLQAPTKKVQEEIGDLLHAVMSLCIFSGFDVEDTLGKVNEKFSRRMRLLKKVAHKHGLENLSGKNIEYMLSLWQEVKVLEKGCSSIQVK